MKKLILLITTLIFHYQIFAQGVGINTTSPDPSAALDIQSNDKGVLIPKVSLNSLIDKTTIANPANGLLIYNTNPNLKNGIGFYFNANTPASPDWRSTAEWKLPYYGAPSEPNSAFLIENYNGGQNSVAIKGYGAGSGTGVHAKSADGVALKAEGGVKIFGNGQNPGVGKVLTSDAEGNAKWEGGVAFKASGIVSGGSEKIAKNTTSKIPFQFEDYDLSGNYINSGGSPHSTFIAPVNGIYHFDVLVSWYTTDQEIKNLVALSLRKNSGGIVSIVSYIKTNSFGESCSSISADIPLLQGDEVFTTLFHQTFDYLDLVILRDANYFSGRLVTKQ